MANLSKTTNDHDEIRNWAEQRGGKPAHVKSTGSKDDIGILRIDFPGFSGEGSLEEISWDEFFEKFDAQGLSLIYQEETADGERSNFNKLVSAATAEESDSGTKSSKKSAASKKSPVAKKASQSSKSAAPSKKAAAAKKATPVKKTAAVKKTATAKKASPVKKTSQAKKGAPAKKAVPVKKSAPAKKSVTGKKSASAKKIPAKKTANKKSGSKNTAKRR